MVTLSGPPALAPLLMRGALRSPFKRPRPGVRFSSSDSTERLVLPGLRLDLARLAAYERVCGFPTGEDALPVTYPHVLGFPLAMAVMSRRDFPLPLLGLVHTSIDITRRRAVAATGTYELTVHVDHLAPHRRGTEAFVVTELRKGEEGSGSEGGNEGGSGGAGGDGSGGARAGAGAGAVVWESTSTYLCRHPTTPADLEPTEPGLTAVEEPALPVLDEWRLAADVGRRYAAASGDRNPIHLHPLTARLFGFPRAIAHGMWTVARCLAAHGTPEAVHLHAEFRAPVLLPGAVTFAADGRRFELRGAGESGRVHVSGRVDPLTGDQDLP
ncbi:MaoC/PaaZ C-terminal domain-containing protein [Streptomyces sp. NBC_01275]|uniref:MaoC family dehydratase n=1 Tax=Streptomyces sp. NBC_01275 TaxID=2903807 RepID=UPI00224DBFD7|nr:MaoC/PaaZ C-terminal domain-containing protein [Streptomyces sp. NBC_01275]MCX4764178.1 MaoC/PaaZ C-terminal domain-containing protein [Streptomyces sp. NBC_01275]